MKLSLCCRAAKHRTPLSQCAIAKSETAHSFPVELHSTRMYLCFHGEAVVIAWRVIAECRMDEEDRRAWVAALGQPPPWGSWLLDVHVHEPIHVLRLP